MRVVLVNGAIPSESLGGSELQTQFIGETLAAEGHEVHFIAMSTEDTSVGERRGSITVHRFSRKDSRRSRVAGLRALLRSLAPDVSYCRIVTWLDPVIQASHEFGVPVIAGLASDRDLQIEDVFEAVGKGKPRLALRRRELNRGARAFRSADAVTAQTEQQKSRALSRWGISAEVLPNIWPDDLTPDVAKNDKPTLIWVGSIKPVKRPELFVEVAQCLEGRGVLCRMIGSIQDEESGKIVRSASVAVDCLEYTGCLPLEETWNAIAGSMALCNTSVLEGFANTFIQAWLSGVPVITAGVDPDGVVGSLDLGVVRTSAASIADAAVALADDIQLQEKMGTAVRRYALDNHTIQAVGSRYETLFAKVAEGSVGT